MVGFCGSTVGMDAAFLSRTTPSSYILWKVGFPDLNEVSIFPKPCVIIVCKSAPTLWKHQCHMPIPKQIIVSEPHNFPWNNQPNLSHLSISSWMWWPPCLKQLSEELTRKWTRTWDATDQLAMRTPYIRQSMVNPLKAFAQLYTGTSIRALRANSFQTDELDIERRKSQKVTPPPSYNALLLLGALTCFFRGRSKEKRAACSREKCSVL